MRTYKNICLWIVITIFACSLYSKGSVEEEWIPMRWKVDNKTFRLPALSTLSVPEEGDSFVFECMNYSDLDLAEIIVEDSFHEMVNSKVCVTSWGHLKCQRNCFYLTIYPNDKKENRSIHVKVKSGKTQQDFNFLQAGSL